MVSTIDVRRDTDENESPTFKSANLIALKKQILAADPAAKFSILEDSESDSSDSEEFDSDEDFLRKWDQATCHTADTSAKVGNTAERLTENKSDALYANELFSVFMTILSPQGNTYCLKQVMPRFVIVKPKQDPQLAAV